jgi:ribosomal protein L12E/L44/L45/RPP1/RPP2
MHNEIQNLIEAAVEENPVQVTEVFSDLIKSRLAEMLDARKIMLAQELTEDETPPEDDEEEDDEGDAEENDSEEEDEDESKFPDLESQ